MRVAVIVTARPSWAKLEPVVGALLARGVDVRIVACASALLERYGAVVHIIRQAYPFVPVTECWTTLEGSTPLTSARETGLLLMDLSAVLSTMQPEWCVVCADRHEVLAAAQAARYLHIPLLHLQGGERSGSIDDDVRDAVTHLATKHAVCTPQALARVYGLTGEWDTIALTGCPSIDVAATVAAAPPVTDAELGGVGCPVDPAGRFLVLLHHPLSDQWDTAGAELQSILRALSAHVRVPLIAFWPGQDPGADMMAKIYRLWREHSPAHSIRLVRNLPPVRFLKLLTQAACLVGNSSAGIRECSYLGVPVVNIGNRQCGRERAANVTDVWGIASVGSDVAAQLEHGPYPRSVLYGDGRASSRIAEMLCTTS